MSLFAEVENFTDLPLAELAKSKLESENVYCCLQNKYHASLKWQVGNALGGIRVLVRSEDYDKAKTILDNDESALLEKIAFPDPETADLCQRCKSENLEYVNLRRYSGALMLLTGVPLVFWGSYYKCKECGFKNKNKA